MTLLEPVTDESGVPDLAALAFVYFQDTPRTMLSSWGVLKDVDALHFPQDISSLVRRVYDEHEPPSGIPSGAWSDAEVMEQRKDREDVAVAHDLLLPDPWLPRAWENQHSRQGDLAETTPGGRFRSRLGEDSIDVALAYQTPEGLRPVAHASPAHWDDVETWRLSTLTMAWGGGWPRDALTVVEQWDRGPMRGARLLILNSPKAMRTLEYDPEEGLSRVSHL